MANYLEDIKPMGGNPLAGIKPMEKKKEDYIYILTEHGGMLC